MHFGARGHAWRRGGLTGSAWGDWSLYTASPLRAFGRAAVSRTECTSTPDAFPPGPDMSPGPGHSRARAAQFFARPRCALVTRVQRPPCCSSSIVIPATVEVACSSISSAGDAMVALFFFEPQRGDKHRTTQADNNPQNRRRHPPHTTPRTPDASKQADQSTERQHKQTSSSDTAGVFHPHGQYRPWPYMPTPPQVQ